MKSYWSAKKISRFKKENYWARDGGEMMQIADTVEIGGEMVAGLKGIGQTLTPLTR